MKPSGVEWLGEVPEHWELRRIKSLSIVNRGASPRPIGDAKYFDDDGEYAWVRIADVTASNRYLEKTTQRLSRLGQSLSVALQPRALFLSIAGSVGKPIITNIPCCIHDGFVYFPHFRGNVEFLFYIFSCRAPFEKLGKFGTQLNLNTDTVGNICLGWPPEIEQTAIARFLGHATLQIERYICAKEKLIALLEEQKQVMIHDAVMGRIDVRTGKPYPAYRPSDVEWLGTIPATWKTIRTKYLLKEVDLRSVTGEETPLSMSQVLGLVPSSRVERSLATASYVGGKLCDEGDLVLNRLKAHLGVFALAQQSGIVSPDYSVFRKRSTANMNFLEQVFRLPTLRTELRTRSKGIVEGFWRLYTDDFFDIFVPVPTEHEQRRIVDYISQVSNKLKRLIDRSKREANLVREYRTRLIADVVTGKLDVREAAANLPELEVIANGDDKTIPAEPDSQQSNTTLHPPTTPGASS